METIEPFLEVFQARRSELGLWLRRSSGYPLLVITNVDDEQSEAFLAGIRNDDIVFRINGRPSWEMSVGDALMMIAFEDADEDANDVVTIEWVSAAHAPLAFRAVRSIRAGAAGAVSSSSQGPSTPRPRASSQMEELDATPTAVVQRARIEQRRIRMLHENQSPQQNARHRERNTHAQMPDRRVVRRRARNLHAEMDEHQVERHRGRGQAHVELSAIHLNYATPCEHCGFRLLVGERRSLCCGDGKATRPPFPPLTPLPPNIRRLATNYPRHLCEQSFQYNNILAFAIIGVDSGDPDERGFIWPGGPSCVKVHGRVYHKLATAQGRRNAVRCVVCALIWNALTSLTLFPCCFRGSYFVYDALDDLRAHGASRALNDEFLLAIHQDLLDVNPYARELRQLGRELAVAETQTADDGPGNNDLNDGEGDGGVLGVRRRDAPPLAIRMTTRTNSRDVGAVIVRDRGAAATQEPTSIMIHLYYNERPHFLSYNDAQRAPLCFPLLFPHGDLGWGDQFTYGCQHAEYMRYRLLMPEPDLQMESQTGQRITVNRFQLLSRVGQVFLVETTSQIEDSRLYYIRTHQRQLFTQEEEPMDDDDIDMAVAARDDGEDDQPQGATATGQGQSQRTFLPSSFTGSVRHLRKLAANALALVSARGKPTVFITLTCNPRWPEITRELLDGQTAFDRPDITCRVFHEKLSIILQLIRQGNIFGPEHIVDYEMRVIEFQFRGLPHAHVVMRLTGLPPDEDVAAVAAWVDRHITTVMPEVSEDPAISSDEDRAYAALVDEHMIHTCNRRVNGCLNERNECKKRFPMPIAERTHFDARGYPVYRRPTAKSCDVVPHNRKLLLLWGGHVNVEFAGHVLLVLYLYKYIFKGADKARVEVRQQQQEAGEAEDEDRDEIKRYLHARYLSSMECMWTTLRFHTYPGTLPPVKCVTVQMPYQLPEGNDISDMLRYFHRPPELYHLCYIELFARYRVHATLPRYAQAENHERYTAIVKGTVQHYFRRRNNEEVVCRMNTVYITAGEVWYLRLILLKRAVVNHEDARTVRGRTYDTFQEAAKALGYATDENEAWLCFNDSLGESTPSELRGLFVLLTREGYPTVRIFRTAECLEAMMVDFVEREDSRQLAYNALLQDLASRLQDNSRCMSDYGLPEPARVQTELQRELRLYDPDEQREWIAAQPAPSVEQQAVMDAVIRAYESGEQLLLFVQGKGGSGKTWLMKRLLAEIRSRAGIAQVCAATGLAATLYQHGTTAHSLFRIPVEDESTTQDEDYELKCDLRDTSQRLELLRATHLFVWDEFPNNHRSAFEAVYRAMNGFEGQILVACGDFRQIPPVVAGGDKWDIVHASVRSSYLWRHFTIHELTIAHRHAADPSYATFVQDLGEGVLGEDLYDPPDNAASDNDGEEDARPRVENAKIVPLQAVTAFSKQTTDEAIAFAYPDLTDALSLSGRAILAATNDLVDEWNTIIQNKRCAQAAATPGARPNAGEVHRLLSADVLTECDDEKGHIRRMLTTEFLNSLNRPGVPPHDLRLAVGDICIVTRNINRKDGLTNNRRVVILSIQPFCVKVQTIGGRPKVFALPRIRFKFRLPHGSFEVMRTQFPLRLAYCMTYNKSQGQELQAVLVDLRKPPFTHGHLYVALSRVRRRDGVAAFVEEEDLEYSATPFTLNIVYPELLSAPTQDRAGRRPRVAA